MKKIIRTQQKNSVESLANNYTQPYTPPKYKYSKYKDIIWIWRYFMAEKVMLCEDCGKMFRVEYDLTKIDELICPSCDGINIVSIYKQQNKIGL